LISSMVLRAEDIMIARSLAEQSRDAIGIRRVVTSISWYTFEEGKAYFERNKKTLVRHYEGKYIAIWENKVLDSDTNFSSLAERVYEKLGYVSIYMPFVTSKRRTLRFESPEYR